MGRGAAAGGRSLSFTERSAALGAGLWRGSAIGARIVKYGAPAVLAYIAIRHPSVINSFFGYAAEKLGLPVGLVQVVGWTLVLLPIILLLRFVLAPIAWIMAGMGRMLRWIDRSLRRRTARRASAY
jgi:CBS domain containing-hemolysin-like protein